MPWPSGCVILGFRAWQVVASVDAPLDLVVKLFTSSDPAILQQWNPYAGYVRNLSGGVQQQIYKMPWPFLKREYLVVCKDAGLQHHGTHSTHCVSHPSHPEAPELNDRVRGSSETAWAFTQV